MIPWPLRRQLIQHGLDHPRGEFLGGEAVAPADHGHRAPPFGQRGHDVEAQGFGQRAAFLGAVEHGDGPRRLGQRREESRCRERAEQPHL
jgi:hypothetical protein